MTATLSPFRLVSSSAMRFGVWRPWSMRADGRPESDAFAWCAEWSLCRQDLMAHRHGFQVYLLSLLLLAAVAAGGGWIWRVHVWPQALLLALLVTMSWLMHARHASDRDHIAMKPTLLRVERHRGGRVHRVDFNPRWVRVEPDQHDGSLVRLSGQGRSVVVGRYVPRDSRRQLAQEFRWALRHLDD